MATTLTPTQRYAAGALLALALRQAQIHQSVPLGAASPDDEERTSSASGGSSASGSASGSGSGSDAASGTDLLTHESRGLLRPVFSQGLISPRILQFLRIVFEENGESSSDRLEQEHALAKAVDVMVMSLGSDTALEDKIKEESEGSAVPSSSGMAQSPDQCSPEDLLGIDKLSLDDVPANHHRKMALLYALLSACVADKPVSQEEEDRKSSHFRKGYDARHRVALRLLATWLDVKWIKVEAIEDIDILLNLFYLAGLAAPAIAAGFGALAPTLGTLVPFIGASGFAAMAAAAGSVAGSVAVAASFGEILMFLGLVFDKLAAGAGLTGSKMARRIGKVKEFEFKPIGDNHNQGRLAVGILVSGFAFDEEDFWKPWEGWKDNLEKYEMPFYICFMNHIHSHRTLSMHFTSVLKGWFCTFPYTVCKHLIINVVTGDAGLAMELMKQGAMRTVLSGLLAAFAWPATLLAATDFIDSKWSVAIDRSDKAGKMLAEVLLKGLQGNRPVTLIGFSLGARVIFKCLQELALSSDNEGLVERVVLLGAPVSVKGERWEPARKMVAGRFVNVYSRDDWILGVTFRASLLTQGLAGIQAIDVPGVENIDVTELVDGHSSYLSAAQQILEHLELNTYYPVFVPLPIVSK
ncbi:hypothetical protein HU200_001476 [Digitaria exilis]|uniref:Transmembrane and coiled-coil domain-containing protein 4 n=1 Tax=Digitaria exilis TaxID=1010633 RepID=A0A835FYH9_9POAL|nr:hypothetical protein HU200_001476 [Digitaria exilis]